LLEEKGVKCSSTAGCGFRRVFEYGKENISISFRSACDYFTFRGSYLFSLLVMANLLELFIVAITIDAPPQKNQN